MIKKTIQKIAILGCGGSGKTTLAKKLALIFQLPIYHLDQYYWKADWVESTTEEWIPLHQSIYTKDQWIIDGNQTRFMHERLPHADLIIFIDRPRWLCLWRVLKRWLKYRNKNRRDLHPGCKDRLTWGFLRYIWVFNHHYRPKIMDQLKQFKNNKKIYLLKTDQEIASFIASLQKQKVK